jgi:hypothetical protein
MKTLTLSTALLLASTAAHAGRAISLDIDGHRIRIEAPKNCDALSCLKITGLSGINLGGLKSGRDDDDAPAGPSAAPAPAPAPPVQAATSPSPPASPASRTASLAPATQTPTSDHLASAAPATLASSAPAPVTGTAAARASATQPAPVAAAPAVAPTTPLGLWATEENKGNVRIEPCGANSCGYAKRPARRS